MNKKGLEDSIFSWILALFIIFFVIVIMDIFAFALIVGYKPDPSASFESGSVSMLDHQYFLNTLAITEKPNYILLDRTKESADALFEIKNPDGRSIPEVFGLDNAAIPVRWAVRHESGDFAHDSLRPFQLHNFDADVVEKVNEIIDKFNEVKAVPVRTALTKHCKIQDSDATNYFFQTPLGVLVPEDLVPATIAVTNFNIDGGLLNEPIYTPTVTHVSTYRGSDHTIKFKILRECFDQLNTEVENE